MSSINSIREEELEVVIVNPNIGHPIFLGFKDDDISGDYETELIFLTNSDDEKLLRRIVKENLWLAPILDYKLELSRTLKKKRKEKEKLEKIKKKGFFKRIKDKIFRKRRVKELIPPGVDVDKYRRLKTRPIRGDRLGTFITNLEKISPISINSQAFIAERNSIQDYVLRQKVFTGVNYAYKIKINFTLTPQIIYFLNFRKFVMFDILYINNLKQTRTNLHSIVITKQNWQNFKFVHATDLHIAERNDKIYGLVKKWTKSAIVKGTDNFFKQLGRKLKIKKLLSKNNEELERLKIPLRKRLVNPNNQFRTFIKLMNQKIYQNDLDFVALTGDLIDFAVLSKWSKQLKNLVNFNYDYSNWSTFKNILMNNTNEETQRGVIKGEELLFPIFTVPGNHDYRPYHYDITWAGMYRKIGLNAAEAVALNELFSSSPITAITKTPQALKGYFSDINPSLDFHYKFGNNLFIFLNSGSDSFKNLKDLISGHPALTGISSKQISYLENLINTTYNESDNIFLFLHGPPINTTKKRFVIKWLEKKSADLRKKIDEFSESVIQKLGKTLSKARIDGKFNVKIGGISNNWEKVVNFCKDFCVLTLTGHTHSLKEYRLSDPETKTSVIDSIPFSLKRVENPAAVYYDMYSELFDTVEEVKKHAPFVVQTPALGLGGYKNPETVGAYREMVVERGKLRSFKVHFLRR